MTTEQETKIKNDKIVYLSAINYDNGLLKMVKIYIPQADVVLEMEHTPSYLVEYESYIFIAENVWQQDYVIGPIGPFPLTIAKQGLEDLKHINALMTKELFTRQNEVNSLHRADFNTDEEFISAVDSVVWQMDLTQIFDFH